MSNITELIERYITPQWRHSGNNNIGIKCPFHKGGNERRESFFINTENGLYYCHTCHIGGTVPRLLNDLGVPKHIIDVETADLRESIQYENSKKEILKEFKFIGDPYKANPILSETILLNYKVIPQPLIDMGFDSNWLNHMEVGLDFQNSRITYPIRDIYGNLAGISGGAVFEGQLPKYKIYSGGYRETHTGVYKSSIFGEWFDTQYPGYEFRKSNFLWNFDRVYARLFHSRNETTIYIVEGFKACLWLLQNGYINTVALMGSSMSEQQFNLLVRLNSDITLFLDNDKAGKNCLRYIASQLIKTHKIYSISYPDNKNQPDDFTKDELQMALSARQLITIKDIIEWKTYRRNYVDATQDNRTEGD